MKVQANIPKNYRDQLRTKNKLTLNNILVFAIILSFSSIWAQENINHVEYSIRLNASLDNNKESDYDGMISNLNAKLEGVKFSLDYNSTASKFKMNDNQLSKRDRSSILDLADMIGGEYYSKVHSDTIFTTNERFVNLNTLSCFSITKTPWIITNERKFINNRECTKAYATLERDLGDGEKMSTYTVTAWFCPKINSSFGPKSYTGLPGLILELEQPLVIFTAVSIGNKTPPEEIKIPFKNLVSEAFLYDSLPKY